MRYLLKFVPILILFFLVVPVCLAQTEESEAEYEEEYYLTEDEETYETEFSGYMFSLDFDWQQPVALTYDRFTKPIFGFNTNIFRQFNSNSPVFWGIGFSIGQYSRAFTEFYDFVEYDEFLFRKTTHFQMLNLELKMRFFPGWTLRNIEPFIDIGAGPRYSYAYTSILNVDLDENSSTYIEGGDWELAYSFGFGGLINLSNDNENIYGHFSLNYSGGNNTFFYLKKDDATGNEEPIDQFDRKSIPVQLLKINFGLIFYL